MRRAIHTGLKEQLLWLQRLRTVEELNQRLRDFVHRFQQPLDHRADRLPNARGTRKHPLRRGPVNTNFNLSQKLGAVHYDWVAIKVADR